MLKTFPSVGVVIIKNNRVLLVVKDNHPKHSYQLPGGQIEPSETPAEAASRELEETTGLVSQAKYLIKIPTEWEAIIEKDYGKAIFPFICFVCRDYAGHVRRTDSATPEWVPLESLNALPLNPNTKNAIDSAMSMN